MTPEFDEFIAIDWSGAIGRYKGIAVATCRPGRSAPALVRPARGHWTRDAIVEWIERTLDRDRRFLIGFDFAFGLPYEKDLGYLAGAAPGVDDIFALWSLIETKSYLEQDFGCTQFISNPDHERLFWKAGPKPAHWIE